MTSIIKWLLLITFLILLAYYGVGFLSSYMGWYGYKKWEYRVGTTDINDSKKRGVFIKELNYKIDSFPGKIRGFTAYIEKGFRYGYHSADETLPLINSNYPFQLSFGYKRYLGLGVLLRKDQLKKFDSSNFTQGFMKYPFLKDTIYLDIVGENVQTGIIKIWQ